MPAGVLMMKQRIIQSFTAMIILLAVNFFLYSMEVQNGIDAPENWRKLNRNITFMDIHDPVKNNALFVNHASKAAISFYNGSRYISYVCDLNFVARGGNYIGDLGIPCRTSEETSDKPRLHSEISFLQYVTEKDNPVDEIRGILEQMLTYHPDEFVTIYIKNTNYPPCATIESGKIPCRRYLWLFRNALGKEKCKVIVYAISTNVPQMLDFNSDAWT
jgi:hypothetical protein